MMIKNKIVKIVLIFTIFSIFTTGCVPKKQSYSAEFMILFNTVTKIISYSDSEAEFEKQSKFIYKELEHYHQLYNIYDDFDGINNIKTINDNAGIKPIKVDKEIIDLIRFSKQMYLETDGQVNIAFGSVLRIWSRYRDSGLEDPENAELPKIEDLKKANEFTDINRIIIDENKSTVFLPDKNMKLDVGAIAKGYATQRVVDKARENGFTNGVVSVGGNVCAVGLKDDGRLWGVGIQNPDKDSTKNITDTLYLSNMTLVSSGDYERYYMVDGVRYHHIINSASLYPSTYFRQVSIVTKDSAIADAYSTAVFNMPLEQGLSLVESKEGLEAMWVLDDNSIVYSDGFKQYQKKP